MSLGSNDILSRTSRNKLYIKLVEPTIILHGSPEDSLGCFLRGELILNLTKPTKIKKIELTFLGKIRLFIPRADGEIASRIHTYPFELFLPGTLPESINTNVGRITYKLSARVLKSGVFTKIRKSQHVNILRTILDEWNQGKVVSNEWKNVCKYEVSFLKKAFPIGDCINIEMKLIPKDKDKYDLQYVHIDLVEKASYNLKTRPKPNVQESTIYESLNSKELCYHETISFRLPNSSFSIHPTYTSEPITISHDLKFLFCLRTFTNNNRLKYKKFTLIVPITIIASKCKDDILPLYYESENDNDSIISTASWDEISFDDVSLPPSYESSIYGSKNNSSVNLGVSL
ncbi:22414_t:CDS:2 [Rhizophagus irregularis]|nr:22414_t:CDS:2 [Rhizophagus irregularis]